MDETPSSNYLTDIEKEIMQILSDWNCFTWHSPKEQDAIVDEIIKIVDKAIEKDVLDTWKESAREAGWSLPP